MGGSGPNFAEVYSSTFSAVWRFAASHGIHGSDLEDVVQEVFVVVHQKLGAFEGRSSVRTWTIGIALNVIRAFRRRRATRKLGEQIDDFPEPAVPTGGPPDLVEARQEAEFLFAFLEELTEAQREVFVVCEIEGLSVVDAADLLEVNENTLRTRLRSARLALNEAVRKREKPKY